MSARGALTTSPKSKGSKLVSESSNYIPLFWLALVPTESWNPDFSGWFELPRKETIERGQKYLPFLTDVFSEIKLFQKSAETLLERLSRLRCKTIGINLAELAIPEPPLPDLGIALTAIEAEDKNFQFSIPARKEVNPFFPGENKTLDIPAREISSTRELLLEVSSLTNRELENAKQNRLVELVIGHVWT
ncbi:hypothetical protein [Blastopirellula marina]|uniref:Uncharacterized protein n=1 Tax=Blastopirellula marina TaxID=124 RepID=A0A2S8GB60_9BACT|nr:hypothetical protein [Blastopirellula marina]PQO41698.1 hypothetical protein C5Y98_02960 [Blastopirellula marina]PTL46141.1 hypothetical protein C5Y97_02960 [Blastopirellula marina]